MLNDGRHSGKTLRHSQEMTRALVALIHILTNYMSIDMLSNAIICLKDIRGGQFCISD